MQIVEQMGIFNSLVPFEICVICLAKKKKKKDKTISLLIYTTNDLASVEYYQFLGFFF